MAGFTHEGPVLECVVREMPGFTHEERLRGKGLMSAPARTAVSMYNDYSEAEGRQGEPIQVKKIGKR